MNCISSSVPTQEHLNACMSIALCGYTIETFPFERCCIVISNYSYSFARKYFSNTQKIIMLKTERTLKTWTIY